MKRIIWIIGLIFVAAGTVALTSSLLKNTEADEIDHSTHNHESHRPGEVVMSDWCKEHLVPESECTQCNPSLIEEFKASGDWCAGHDLPESHCRLCNPEIVFPQEEQIYVAEISSDWCAEHSVPESECTKCNPSLIEEFKASGDWCAGHGLPESHCRLCNPEIVFPQEKLVQIQRPEIPDEGVEVSLFFRPNQDVCATNDALIQFASPLTAEKTGITTYRVVSAKQESTTKAPAEVLFDENSTSVISSTVKSLVSRWLISPGDIVEKNDPIAILQSPEMAELQAKYLSAAAELEVQKQELERIESLRAKNLTTLSEYERRNALYKKARAELTGLRGRLLSSGMNNQDIDRLLDSGSVSKEFIFKASASGLIAQRIAQVGELLEDGQPLALLTNPSSLWIEAHLTEDQINRVSMGQNLVFSSDDGTLNRSSGKIIWISPYLDPHSRTGIVRASVSHAATNLRAGDFGTALIMETSNNELALVPKDAVQWEGCCNVVFVKEAADRFRPRKVAITDGPDSYYQVTQGLSAGEEIVVNGSFLLKTELKKTSIGAGCCGIEPVG
ncbi:MAG: efflux RND transporter periplasmic adaptor subunit [candidate division Zixibacteria bacterium]|nr:efflux RND transporter periplasmic adaptor subunit [candidate division Zixibacteria bacterium]